MTIARRATSSAGGSHKAKYHQENQFFDGSEQELSSQRVVLRVRSFITSRRSAW